MRPLPRPTAMRLIFALALAVLFAASPVSAQVLNKGDRLAELDTAVDASGKKFQLRSLKGKWVLVTVGAEWCKPCAKELPMWDKLAGLLKDKITFVAIAVDDKVDDAKKFHAKLKLKNMKLVYMPGDKSAVAARYGAATMPSSFVADPNQIIKLRKDGFEERDPDGEYKKMRDQLKKLIDP
jgi:thiol-disulfide isomerase/thioredoxin